MIRMPKTQQNSSLSTIAVAALVGGLAGAAVGLMFAPKSGRELRRGIYRKADDAIDHVEDVTSYHAGTLKQQGTNMVDKGKKLAEDLQTFIQESLKMKKSGYVPININNTQAEETLQPQAEAKTKTEEETPLTLVQPEIPLKEE